MSDELEQTDLFPGCKKLEDFTKGGFQTLMNGIKSSNALPCGRNYDYYKIHESFTSIANDESNRIMRVMAGILQSQNLDQSIRSRLVDEKVEVLIEANDTILERVANNIDEMSGIKRVPDLSVEFQSVSANLPVNGSWNQLNKANFSVVSSSELSGVVEEKSLPSIRLLTAKNIIRPQKFFKDKIDNNNSHPWMPRITDKPNSLKPLAVFLEETENGNMYTHPYEFELDRFEPPAHQLAETVPVEYLPITETPLLEVTTDEELQELVEELRNHTEFAVDLEHHSYRSFMGITCIMQISTNNADYIIDTLSLRDKLHVLNEVFTKPTILKIFHGADHDIQWLQRDLSIYVVNMFDTHQAAKQLEYSGLSLAYLLNRFCGITPNKHFQLADWRIRPLPEELKTYARMDTHYLLHVYHVLKNELLKQGNGNDNILRSIFQRSTELCKKIYMKPMLTDDSHLDLYRKCKRLFNNRQLYALKELYKWRDTIARTEDESTGYVLPNHMLLQISESLPREVQGILACCNPIPPLVRSSLLELHKMILTSREQPLEKPILNEETRSRGSTLQFSKINIDSPLYCPHDLSKASMIQENLPTLLNDNNKSKVTDVVSKLEIETTKSMYSIFNELESTDIPMRKTAQFMKFLGPYERYMLMKPYIEEEERKAAENRAEQADNPSIKPQNEPTDEERMAALHDHFLQVSKDVQQSPVTSPTKDEDVQPVRAKRSDIRKAIFASNKTLIQRGGSKKRKRPMPDPAIDNPEHSLHTHPVPDAFYDQAQDSHEDPATYSAELSQQNYAKRKRIERNNWNLQNQTNAPGQGKKMKAKKVKQTPNKWKKTKQCPRPANATPDAVFAPQDGPAQAQSTPAKQRKQQKKLKQQLTFATDSHLENNAHMKEIQKLRSQNKQLKKEIWKQKMQTNHNQFNYQNQSAQTPNRKQNSRQQQQQHGMEASTSQHPPHFPNAHNKGQHQNVRGNKRHNNYSPFTPYDYSTVDYRQFQGGAGSAAPPQNLRSNFRGKAGRGRWNNRNSNRSMTFANPRNP